MPIQFNSPRYQQWFVGQQADLLLFAPPTQLIRVDQGSLTTTRVAPYSRFPILTGTKSEVKGIRGRKHATWAIRGLPLIPSGTGGPPDIDIILQNIFGQPSAGGTYTFLDAGYLPFSLYAFNTVPGFTQRALWGCFVQTCTFHFNGLFMTMDLSGFAGYEIDSAGFAAFDPQALAGLGAFPGLPGVGTSTGAPIAGFGQGYTMVIDTQAIPLKIRAMSLTIHTGFTPIEDVYGSAYMAAVVGDARRISVTLSDILDDDSPELIDLKTKADTDDSVATPAFVTATITAGNQPGSIVNFTINNVQLNAFNLVDRGPTVSFELGESFGHATAPGLVDDFQLQFA